MKTGISPLGKGMTTFPLLLLCTCIFCLPIKAQVTPIKKESAVDFLEQIYFSGEDKDGLKSKMLVASQLMESYEATPTMVSQFENLQAAIKASETVETSCDILELLAVAIYNLDAVEAAAQGVKVPSAKSKASMSTAGGDLGQLAKSSSKLSNTARRAAINSYTNTGRSTDVTKGLSKVGSAAGAVSSASSVAADAGLSARDLTDMFKSKKKPCKDVPKKEIILGEHKLASLEDPVADTEESVPATESSKTILIIDKVTSANLRSLCEALKGIDGVQDIEKTFSSEKSTITVIHTGDTDKIADWLEDNYNKQFKLVSYKAGEIVMAAK